MQREDLPQRLRIVAGGMRFVARMNPSAPRTAAAFSKVLPFRNKLIHVRWSGEACWVPLGDLRLDVEFENHTSHPAPGDVLFYPGGYSETELLIVYGACSFASRMGPLAGNHFMTIIEGRDQLRELGERVLWQGAQDLLIEADDDASKGPR
jgi:hypothetical protein